MASNWYAGPEGRYAGPHQDTSGDPYGPAAATAAPAHDPYGQFDPYDQHPPYAQYPPPYDQHPPYDPYAKYAEHLPYPQYGQPADAGQHERYDAYAQHDHHAGYEHRAAYEPLAEPFAESAEFSHFPGFPGFPGFSNYAGAPGPDDDAPEPVGIPDARPASLAAPSEDVGEWNPSEDDLRPFRGRHRVGRQRGGTIGRSRAVLGVGVIAAVGAGGMATANEEGAGSVPGLGDATDKVKAIPDSIPLIGSLVPDSGGAGPGSDSGPDAEVPGVPESPAEMVAQAPFTTAGITQTDIDAGQTDAGEALRTRILQQADQQEAEAAAEAREQAVAEAEAVAAEEAAALAEEEAAAEAERRRQEEEERRRREEEERLRQLRASYIAPLTDFTYSASFGESSSYWASTHTGQDFASPTGTPVMNVHTGTVTEAAWAGDYGYRIIVTLEDGTEVWYCHLSSINVSVGQEVVTQDVIGNVGSTGNSSGPHLHLEVRPGGSDPVDPLAWLRNLGVAI